MGPVNRELFTKHLILDSTELLLNLLAAMLSPTPENTCKPRTKSSVPAKSGNAGPQALNLALIKPLNNPYTVTPLNNSYSAPLP